MTQEDQLCNQVQLSFEQGTIISSEREKLIDQEQMQPSSYRGLSLLFASLGLICQLSLAFNPYAPTGCLRGWTKEGSCYRVFEDPLSWHEARKVCHVLESTGELASFHDAAELGLLAKILQNSMDLRVWIGLSDEDGDGRWVWTDGSAAKFVPWAKGEPNDPHLNACVSLFRGDAFMKFRAEPCFLAESFLCKHTPRQSQAISLRG